MIQLQELSLREGLPAQPIPSPTGVRPLYGNPLGILTVKGASAMEKRKCPYCGEEMVPGKICARESTGLLFRASCAPRFLKNYELGVTDFFRWDIDYPASVCLPCGKLILDLPEEPAK